MKRAFLHSIVAILMVAGLTGCTSISYYARSLNGHAQIMSARQDVEKLIEDPATPAALRSRMSSASAIRQFATDQLALPDNDSYRDYVDVGRDYVSWAVFATPEFSLAPRTWCVPIFGCVPYRGYFSEATADSFAADLRRQGHDVHVSGIPAYSTLGWSSDPLLSTMLNQDDIWLAGVVFHELAHQRVYVRDDSAFNEAFAVAVEVTGVRKLLRMAGNDAGLHRYEAHRKRNAEFLSLVAQARDELRRIYAGTAAPTQKRAGKAEAIERLRMRYRRIRNTRWDGYAGYDSWFEAPINNAKLAATFVYSDQVPAFMRLLDICAGDYPRFYAAVERIGALDKADRGQALEAAPSCDKAGLT